MKLLVQVDQKASLAAGCDAPHSTTLLDFDPALLSERARKLVAENIDLATGQVRFYGRWNGSNYGRSVPVITAPVTTEKAITQLELDVAEVERQQAAEKAEKQAEQAKADAELAVWLATPDAELIQYTTARSEAGRSSTRVLDGDGDVCPEYDARGEKIYLSQLPPDTRIALKPDVSGQAGPAKEKQLRLVALARAHNLPIHAEGLRRKAQLAAEQAADKAQREESIKSIITSLGTDTQKARFERGLMADPLAEATQLLADDVFKNVPLDVATPPTADDIDLSKWEDHDCPDYLPDIKRDEEKAAALTDEQMAAFLAAEKLILAQVPEAKVEPWLLQITRDHEYIPWHSKAVARATSTHLGLPITRDFDLP